jgi:hypothetical protein
MAPMGGYQALTLFPRCIPRADTGAIILSHGTRWPSEKRYEQRYGDVRAVGVRGAAVPFAGSGHHPESSGVVGNRRRPAIRGALHPGAGAASANYNSNLQQLFLGAARPQR